MSAQRIGRSGFDWSTVPDAREQGESARRRLLDSVRGYFRSDGKYVKAYLRNPSARTSHNKKGK